MKLRIEQLNLYLLITYIPLNIIELLSEPGPQSLGKWILYLSPFVCGLGLFLIFKGWKSLTTNYFIYIAMGLFLTFMGSSGNTSGALFLCFAVTLRENAKDTVKLIIITIIFISLKAIRQTMSVGEVINFIGLYSFFGVTDYVRIQNIKKKASLILTKNYSLSNISKEVIDIIALRIQGFDYPEINDKLELNIDDKQVSRKLNIAMKNCGFKTREGFIFYMSKMEIIKTIIDNDNTYNK